MDIDNDILSPYLEKKKKITGIIYKNDFIDIGTKFFLNKAKKFIEKKIFRPSAFFDRDGVINYDYKYVHTKRKFVWMAHSGRSGSTYII